jgi:transposase InsO family protein
VYTVLVLAWDTKKIVGYCASNPYTAMHWLTAPGMVVNRQFPARARGEGLALMRDHGSQPTAMMFMRACARSGDASNLHQLQQPMGNADTHRVMRTLKEECLWLQERTSPLALLRAIGGLGRALQCTLSALSPGLQSVWTV